MRCRPRRSPGPDEPRVRGRRAAVLWSALALHLVFLLVYCVLALGFAGGAGMQDGFDKAFWIFYFAVAWIVLVCGFVWLIVLVNLIRWWHQARKGLVSRVVAWDCLLWLGPALVLLLPWRRTRQLLVPE